MTGAQHAKRLDTLKTKRRFIEQSWKDAYDNTYPLRGQLIGLDGASSLDVSSSAKDKQARIYDSALRDSARLLASALLSGLTPANSRWFSYSVTGLKKDHEAEKWLNESSDLIWQNIHNCNYDSTAYDLFIDYVCAGMPVMYIEQGNLDDGKLYNFRLWPLHSCYFADSTGKGLIDTVYRVFSLTAEQAVNEYGNKLSDKIIKAAADRPDTPFQFLQSIYPRGKGRKRNELPIASEHVELHSKRLIRKSGYHEMPVIVPRWLPIPDSVYSEGPVADALPDHKTLNEVVKLILANADLAIAGMWGVVDDGVVNPKTITIGARKVVVVGGKDSIFPLKSGTQFDVAQLEIQRLQGQIRRTLMSDQLHPQDGPQMTATEVHLRTQLIRQLLGPMYGRLQSEFLNPLVERCFGIAFRAGVLGIPPESIQKSLAKVSYQSPLARSQRLEDVAAMDRFEGSLAVAAQSGLTDVLDNYDIDEATRERARLLGVSAKLIRDEKTIEKIRKDRAAAVQAAQQAQQQQEMQKTVMPMAVKGAMDAAAA